MQSIRGTMLACGVIILASIRHATEVKELKNLKPMWRAAKEYVILLSAAADGGTDPPFFHFFRLLTEVSAQIKSSMAPFDTLKKKWDDLKGLLTVRVTTLEPTVHY
jgi:hypothetical protein